MDIYDKHSKVTIAKFRAFYPELLEDCKPILPEMTKSQMKAIYDAFIDLRGNMPKIGKGNEIILLAAVFALFFDPDYLHGFRKKTRNRFRSMASEVIGIKERLLSYYLSLAINQMIIRSFKNQVEQTAKIISENTGIILEN